MNVLMVVSWYTPQGSDTLMAGVFHYEQAKALSEKINVCIYHPSDDSINEKITVKNEWGIKTYRSKLENNPIGTRMLFNKTMNKIMAEFKPDIIHTNVALGISKLVVKYAKNNKIPVVVSEHLPVELMNINRRKNKRIIEKVYRGANVNTCCSNYVKEELQRLFPDIHFQTIYNGILPIEANENTIKYRADGYVNMCIVAGFYDKNIKGFQYLLPAIAGAKLEYPNIKLHVVGDGTYLEYYKNKAIQLGIDENCIFYGAQNKTIVYQIVQQMDFGISASIIESAGVSIQEMMLAGKPVLVTKSGGGNSLVMPSTALVVEKGDVESLKLGLIEMIRNYAQFDATTIRSYAQNMFSIDASTKQYLSVYNDLLKEVSRRGDQL